MPRERKNPQPMKVAHYDTIDLIGIQIAYDNNLKLSQPNTEMVYAITNRDAGGQPVHQMSVNVKWKDLPKEVQGCFQKLHKAALKDAEEKGFVGEGDDRDDI